MSGIEIRRLTFTGPGLKPASLHFQSGLNVIYGASNTGKSFAGKALVYMLGGSTTLPQTDEVVAYDGVWLSFVTGQRELTLYRSTRGGAFRLFEGFVASDDGRAATSLAAAHDSARTDNVSHLVLDAMGLAGKRVVKDGNGAKENLSIRLLSPYAVVSEGDIIAERSPVRYSGTPTQRTFEENLFKLLLTGMDDAGVVEVQKPSERKVAKEAKLELIDDLIAGIERQLGENPVSRPDVEKQLERLNTAAASILDDLLQKQESLDLAISNRRRKMDSRQDLHVRLAELQVTIGRFIRLEEVYASDVRRLHSIEESGYVLTAMARRECPVCGAPPEAQTHDHGSAEIALAYRAASAEAAKIEVEQRELALTIKSLQAEATGIEARGARLDEAIESLDRAIEEARPTESGARQRYEQIVEERNGIQRTLDLHDRRDGLAAQRAEIASRSTKKSNDKLVVGPDAVTSYAFGEVVREVLEAWKFPNAAHALFDNESYDVSIAGKPRAANGKGVRAIMRAAFNVGLLIYCHRRRLPTPGFLVLDTPLLTYREPTSVKHGALAADEAALKKTTLAEHFYKHLAGLSDIAQIIVLENTDPPASIEGQARIEMFTGVEGEGRYGLFPAGLSLGAD
ncbi:hypothetical protein [Rhizobium straminoryzae]|uniref:Uncharacterized protein n=1 Tax=Rhizobium straminoryzae TaxID=1387186 RepID=A0A549SHH2_9HYPH|nr:hypothetical protein [Rhizobium straminoryzae]TRL29085.1 hypothetical protein FNA46_25740 [Rhizobium straminoryzae]